MSILTSSKPRPTEEKLVMDLDSLKVRRSKKLSAVQRNRLAQCSQALLSVRKMHSRARLSHQLRTLK